MVFSKSRTASWLISFILLLIAFYLPNEIEDLVLNSPLDMISYWGTIATIVGLVITVFEVLHNVQITTKAQTEIKEEISKIRNIRDASIISDSISILRSMLIEIDGKNYQMARKSFDFYRIISRPLDIDYLGSTTLDKLKYIDENLRELSNDETDHSRQEKNVKTSTNGLIRQLEEMDPVKSLSKS